MTNMYLKDDAKLWWCTHLSNDTRANRDKIEIWEVMKKELKDQFLPCNTSWLARESLQKTFGYGERLCERIQFIDA